jgi:hypothetical protein
MWRVRGEVIDSAQYIFCFYLLMRVLVYGLDDAVVAAVVERVVDAPQEEVVVEREGRLHVHEALHLRDLRRLQRA